MFFQSILQFLSKLFCFSSYFTAKNSFPKPLPAEKEREYLQKMKEGDALAREELIRHNLRLVAHVAKKYNNVLETDDLISIGSIGLVKGVETFDSSKGTQLATYLARCIENEIRMVLRSQKRYQNTVSLQEPLGIDGDGNEFTLMDVLPVKEETIFHKAEDAILAKQLDALLKESLSEREYRILVMRFGLDGSRPLTQLETAERLGISRSYISRIETKAMATVKERLLAEKVFPF